LINELVAHTDTGLDPPFESNDRIELYNPTEAPIVLDAHWFLSDNFALPEKWNIPSGTTIPAKGWIAFDEDDFHPNRTAGFGLDKAGEQLLLSYRAGGATDRVVDCVAFKGQANGASWGRYPDGDRYFQTVALTLGAANQLPAPSVWVQELMYHPKAVEGHDAEAELEYIMLTNGSAQTISFCNPDETPQTWRMGGGVQYSFAPDASIAPNESLWIVPFDPANGASKAFFCSTYGLDSATAHLVGPYSGELANTGERIVLEYPQASDDPNLPEDISWIIVDEIIWLDEAPWPKEVDGSGWPLVRVGAAGNDPQSWVGGNDMDNDGLPDAWEKQYRPNLDDLGAGDFDGDGLLDTEEYIAGTNPDNPDSTLEVRAQNLSTNGIVIHWDAVTNRTYRVFWTSNLTESAILLKPDLAYPATSYTDQIHQTESAGFYFIDVQTNEYESSF
jgi:hypothetical protein